MGRHRADGSGKDGIEGRPLGHSGRNKAKSDATGRSDPDRRTQTDPGPLPKGVEGKPLGKRGK